VLAAGVELEHAATVAAMEMPASPRRACLRVKLVILVSFSVMVGTCDVPVGGSGGIRANEAWVSGGYFTPE
jgi:hypothetical protein